jgi:hypothetical protein
MRYRSVGRSGLVVSVAGLGCNNFGRRLDAERTRAVVDAAIEAGITLLDTADSYGPGRARRPRPGYHPPTSSPTWTGLCPAQARHPEPAAELAATAVSYRSQTAAKNLGEYEMFGLSPPCW